MADISNIVERVLEQIVKTAVAEMLEKMLADGEVFKQVMPKIVERFEAEVHGLHRWDFDKVVASHVARTVEEHYGEKIKAVVDERWRQKLEEAIPELLDKQMRAFVDRAFSQVAEETRQKLWR